MHQEHRHASDHEHSHAHGHGHEHPPAGGAGSTANARAGGRNRLVVALLVVALCCLAYASTVFVDETEYVVVTQFGKIVGVYDEPGDSGDRGLQFKWPWQSVRRFDRRLQLFDPPAREMLTADKKNVTIDAFICWRIADPRPESQSLEERPVVRFLRAVGSAAGAESRVDERVRSILGDELGKVNMADLVSEEGWPGLEGRTAIEELSDRVTQRVRNDLQGENSGSGQRNQDLGIEVVDVGLKRFNLPEENRSAVYNRMRSERKRIAVEYRSQGEAEASKIRSLADLQREQALAGAYAQAQRIRGEGEARATEIYSSAHGQDPEFYQLLRTLDAYKKILNEKTTLVLSAGSSMLRLLNDGLPELPAAAPPTLPAAEAQPADSSTVASDGKPERAPEGATP